MKEIEKDPKKCSSSMGWIDMYCEFTVCFERDEFTVHTHHLVNPMFRWNELPFLSILHAILYFF